jgi:hypothetical protein
MSWMFGSRALEGTTESAVEISGWMAVAKDMEKLMAHIDTDPDNPIS